jgi:hypothetical protein
MRVIGPVSAVRREQVNALADKLDSGELAVISGELCEPIDEFSDQEQAMIRAQIEHRRSGCVHKVVMSADLSTS